MDPAKSGLSSSSGLHYPALARMGGSLKPIQNTDPKMQNAPLDQFGRGVAGECILRNTPINSVIKCQHVSWFLIKVDLVEN